MDNVDDDLPLRQPISSGSCKEQRVSCTYQTHTPPLSFCERDLKDKGTLALKLVTSKEEAAYILAKPLSSKLFADGRLMIRYDSLQAHLGDG